MPLRWREDVFACSPNGQTILLDLRTGRYAAMSSSAGAALHRLQTHGELDAAGRQAVAPLVARGLLIPTASEVPRASPRAPTTDIASDMVASVRSGEIVLAFSAHLAARMLLRVLGLPRLYRALRWSAGAAPGCHPRYDERRACRLAFALGRAELLLTRRDRCLARSVAFKLLAALYQMDVTLVIGVEVRPFSAHCWIEHDGCVLNGPIDEVTPFTPILAV